MSAAVKCDFCGAIVSPDSDPAADWLSVTWGVGNNRSVSADYCTSACAVAGIEKWRDQDAEEAFALLEDDGEDES